MQDACGALSIHDAIASIFALGAPRGSLAVGIFDDRFGNLSNKLHYEELGG
jgi:hypothetical protein